MRRPRASGRYFDGPRPRIFAHRGFVGATDAVPENTLAAFHCALDAGATHIESDVHATRDGVAVLVHDAEIHDVDGRRIVVAETVWAELEHVDLGGGHGVPSLASALEAEASAPFNLDIKSSRAADPVVAAVLDAHAVGRVLITSFSERRRRSVVRRLDGVATSASAVPVLLALLAAKLGLTAVVRWVLRDVDALQIPERAAGIRTTGPRTLRALRVFGGEIHIWTINEPATMRRLLAAGVDGIVTDRTDSAVIAAAHTGHGTS
ncbi:glycerophosphodiester phosphodiesterase [Microbacteriaceae bacterium VKM Ac-2855]|nr:glycerophosphodiester phosphodiesterase [Microbacteriaceae bacterium VKM Ac-2855]